jgi:hypothetical protein
MSDVVVVDASLAFKWVLAEPDSHSAIILLNQWTDEGMSIIAPAFFEQNDIAVWTRMGCCWPPVRFAC